MKTIFINGSPKKKFSASSFFIDLTRLFTRGKSVVKKLRTKQDGTDILPQLESGDAVVFSLPLYVDGIPSHVLYFLKDMEIYCREHSLDISVYVICNNGFIEGCQSAPQFKVFENFCARSGIKWRGGLGIGGGVMLNVLRIMLMVYVGILILNMVSSGIQTGNFLPVEAFGVFAEQAFVTLFFSLGVIVCAVRLGAAIGGRRDFGERFTRILVPSFIFIIFADIFFVVVSVFQGGIFRGWFAKKR